MTTSTSPPSPAPALPGLGARLVGILTSPRETFAAVVATPRWADMLGLAIVVAAVLGVAFLSTEVGRQALLDQQVASMESFGVQVSEAQYAALRGRLRFAPYIQTAGLAIGVPLVTFGVAGLLFGVFSGLLGGGATFRQVLAVVAHCSAVNVVQQLFVVPLNYARESMSSPTNLSVFLPMLDEGSFLASFFGTIDLFVVWWSIVLGIGLGVLYRRRTGPIVAGLFVVYGVIAVALAALRTALGGQ